MELLWGIFLLPIGFAIQAIALLKTKTFPRLQGILFLFGVLLVGTPDGLSNRAIGERLYLALDTVKGHNRRIFDKLQVENRTEAVARAHELSLL